MKEIIIDSEQKKRYLNTLISEMKIDGSETVITKKTDKSPTARQRRLWRKWCAEVSVSGLGQDIIAENVHIRAKWLFVRPLMIQQSGMFAGIYNRFMETVRYSPEKAKLCFEFARDFISTEDLTKENRVQSLKEFQRYWIDKGAELTDPSLMGLEKYLE